MRRVEEVRIEGDPATNRDAGKLFIVTEMPAVQAERWASRLIVLLSEAGADVPEGWEPGSQSLAELLKLGAPFIKVLQDPSLEEWWGCVKYQHRPNQMPQAIVFNDRCQIEEVSTVGALRMKVLELHTGFFSAVKRSTSEPPSAATPTGSLPTRISRPPLAR